MSNLSPAALAAQDQHDARERDFDRKAQHVAIVLLLLVSPVLIWAILAAAGIVPPAPWSAMGQTP